MKSWRVLMVSEPGMDGVFTVVDSLVRHIHSNHPEISVDLAYSSQRSGQALRDLIGEIERRGDRTIDLKVGNAPRPSDFRAVLDLARLVRERHPQVVHAHSSKAGALARIARLFALVPPVFYSPHAYYGMPRLGGRKEKLFNAIESALGRVGTTINCSEDERDFAIHVLRIPPNRLRVVHNGTDTARFAPPDADGKALARAKLGLPANGKILITIGRDSPQKNYAPLYGVLDDLLPDAGWSFAHAGAGSIALRDGLRPAAAARCHGFEHLDDVLPLLHAADGFVMTSRYEGLSLAMLSALSCGLPAFLTDVPGFHFLKEFGFDEIAWLPDTSSPENVADALETSLRSWAARPPEV
ncbi:MAG: glycosyltransferase family 4 protein, partial [Verrucomicrobiota bacterium]